MPDSPGSGSQASEAFSVAKKFGYNTVEIDASRISWERTLPNVAYTAHCLPDMERVPHVIGVLTVPKGFASESMSGYHVSDFLAFASLLHGTPVADSQAWLTLFDIRAAMAEHGATYGHSKQFDTGLVTKVTDILDKRTFVKLQSAEEMRSRFLDEVAKRSSGSHPLLIVVCGETTLEQTIFFHGPDGPTVTKNDIRDILKPDCQATLVTASPFTGGWLVNPFLGHNPKFDDHLAPYLASIHCGGAFTQKYLDEFQDNVKSPLVPSDQKRFITGFPSALTEHGCFTKKAQAAHQFFHEAVRRMMASRTTNAAAHHAFNFSEETNENPGPRKGPPPSYWKERWDALPRTLTTAQSSGFEVLGTSFGGIKDSQTLHVRCLVRLEKSTCKGDWGLLTMSATEKLFNKFLETKNPVESDLMHVLDVIEYRSSAMMVADIVIDALGLRRPQGQMCRDWDFSKFCADEKANERLREAKRGAFGELPEQTFTNVAQSLGRVYDKNFSPIFHRPALYLAAAIAEHAVQNFEQDDLRYYQEWARIFVRKYVNKVVDCIMFHQKGYLLRDEKLMGMGKTWIDSLELSSEARRPVIRKGGLGISRHAPKARALTTPGQGRPSSPPGLTAQLEPTDGGNGEPVPIPSSEGVSPSPTTHSDEEPMPPSASAFGGSSSEFSMAIGSSDSIVSHIPESPHQEASQAASPMATEIQETAEEVLQPEPSALPATDEKQAGKNGVPKEPVYTADQIFSDLMLKFPNFSVLREDFLRPGMEFVMQASRSGHELVNPDHEPAMDTATGMHPQQGSEVTVIQKAEEASQDHKVEDSPVHFEQCSSQARNVEDTPVRFEQYSSQARKIEDTPIHFEQDSSQAHKVEDSPVHFEQYSSQVHKVEDSPVRFEQHSSQVHKVAGSPVHLEQGSIQPTKPRNREESVRPANVPALDGRDVVHSSDLTNNRHAWIRAARNNEAAGFPGYPYVNAGSQFESGKYRTASTQAMSPAQGRMRSGMNRFRVLESPPKAGPLQTMGFGTQAEALEEKPGQDRARRGQPVEQLPARSTSVGPTKQGPIGRTMQQLPRFGDASPVQEETGPSARARASHQENVFTRETARMQRAGQSSQEHQPATEHPDGI